MKKMKYAKIALAAVVSAALLQGGTALAKKKGELSVYEWGPWAVMARPAAGPQFVAFTPKGNPDPYHPTPKPVPPKPVPPKPVPPKPVPPTPPVVEHVGWATYSLYSNYKVTDETPVYSYGRIIARFADSIEPHVYSDKFDVDYLEESLLPTQTVTYKVGPPILASLSNYPQVNSLSMPGVFLGSDQHPYDPQGTFKYLEDNLPLPDHATVTPVYAYKEGEAVADADGSGNTHTRWSRMTGYVFKGSAPWNLDMVVGAWGNGVIHKAAGIIESGSEGTTYEYFVYGTTTSLAAIDGLQAGNVTAVYSGTTLGNRTPVDMTINFGDGTWHGSWNGGVDSNVQVSKDGLGVWHATGNMGFNANGTLSGPNLVAKTISDQDHNKISGVVENAVFGSNAQMVGGGYQITKTLKTGAYNDVHGEPVTPTATQADVTIAVKVNPNPGGGT